jgi:uncharacterized protein YjiS (DUF1127 family)
MKTVPMAATGRWFDDVREHAKRRRLLHWLSNSPRMISEALCKWRHRSRSRAALATLDDRMLKDIGITRIDVWREVNKPFWRE